MKQKRSLKGMWQVFKHSLSSGFLDHNITKLSGALAYFTVFSMGPLLVVIISLCGLFLGREAVEGRIYLQLAEFVGPDTALQLQEIIKNAFIGGKGKLAAIIGGVTLLVGATTVFAEIQDSINYIWGLKPKPKKGWLKMLQNRFLSFSVVIGLGFLLTVSLGITTIVESFSNNLKEAYPDVTVVLFYVLNLLLTFAITTLIFSVIFKVLPDADIQWKDVIAGAVATALLFMLGKFGISYYISKSEVGSTYGTAGSLVVVLIWIYYSSIILYLGAEFTKAYAVAYGSPIHPSKYAVSMVHVEVETGKATVQKTEEITEEVKESGAKVIPKK